MTSKRILTKVEHQILLFTTQLSLSYVKDFLYERVKNNKYIQSLYRYKLISLYNFILFFYLTSSRLSHFIYFQDQVNIESKIRSIRFVGELVNLQVFSKHEALQLLKMLLKDFTHHHIEMACNLLDTCGRFLYRSIESHHRTKAYLVSRIK